MTVISRIFASSPARSADATWSEIASFLTRGQEGSDYDELISVIGTAASLIADHAPKTSAIVITCEGPRTRIRCIYDDDAVDGSAANEAPAGFDPLKGDWAISLPCPADDLNWVQANLARTSTRITARDLAETSKLASEAGFSSDGAMEMDVGSFLS